VLTVDPLMHFTSNEIEDEGGFKQVPSINGYNLS
jgi:hypothetical protein